MGILRRFFPAQPKPQEETTDEDPVAFFQKAVRVDPRNPQAMFNLGTAYFIQGKFYEAEDQFLQAVAQNPRHFDSHYYLGLIYASRGDKEKARHELELVAREDPRMMMRGFAERKLRQLDGQKA